MLEQVTFTFDEIKEKNEPPRTLVTVQAQRQNGAVSNTRVRFGIAQSDAVILRADETTDADGFASAKVLQLGSAYTVACRIGNAAAAFAVPRPQTLAHTTPAVSGPPIAQEPPPPCLQPIAPRIREGYGLLLAQAAKIGNTGDASVFRQALLHLRTNGVPDVREADARFLDDMAAGKISVPATTPPSPKKRVSYL